MLERVYASTGVHICSSSIQRNKAKAGKYAALCKRHVIVDNFGKNSDAIERLNLENGTPVENIDMLCYLTIRY